MLRVSRINEYVGEGVALFLRFHHARGVSVHVEQVIGEPVAWRELEFADRNASSGVDVDVGAVLNQPSGFAEQAIDLYPGAILRALLTRHRSSSRIPHASPPR